MIEFKRESFVHDAVLHKLFTIIKNNHRPASHTEQVLLKNKNVKDFCEDARHFITMPGLKPLFIHYDVRSWLHNGAVICSIRSIGIYDNEFEYQKARMSSTEGAEFLN